MGLGSAAPDDRALCRSGPGTARDGRRASRTAAAVVGQEKMAGRRWDEVSGGQPTAHARLLSRQRSGQWGSSGADAISKLISIYERAPPAAKGQSHPRTGKVSIPPAFLAPPWRLSSPVRLDSGPPKIRLQGEERIRQHSRLLTKKAAADPFPGTNRHISSSRPPYDNYYAGNCRNVRIIGRDAESAHRSEFPTAPKQHGLLIRSVNEYKSVAIAVGRGEGDLSAVYRSARAVFAGESVGASSDGASSNGATPGTLAFRLPRAAPKTGLCAFPEARVIMVSSQRTTSTRAGPRQIPHWAYRCPSPIITNVTWVDQPPDPESPGKPLPSQTLPRPAPDFKMRPEWGACSPTTAASVRRTQPASAFGEAPIWPRMPTAALPRSHEPASAGGRRLAPREDSPRTSPDDHAWRRHSFHRGSQAVSTSLEAPRANGKHRGPPLRAPSVAAGPERPCHGDGRSCVAEISRRYGESRPIGSQQSSQAPKRRSGGEGPSIRAAAPREDEGAKQREAGGVGGSGACRDHANLKGWVSRVVGYFERAAAGEQTPAERSAPEASGGGHRHGVVLGSRRFASCPEEGSSRLEPRKFASLPRDWRRTKYHRRSAAEPEVTPPWGVRRSESLSSNRDSRGEENRRWGSVPLARSVPSAQRRPATDASGGPPSSLDPSPLARDQVGADWECEGAYLRRKLTSYSSEDGSQPSSPDADYRFFRRAVYGSVFASEGAYFCPDSPLRLEDSDSSCLSPPPCCSPSLGFQECCTSAANTNESESDKSNSSDENLDYDSGVVDDNEEDNSLCKVLQPPQPSLRITDIVENSSTLTLWSHIPEIANSDFFRMLSSNQLKLQETKFEVITTETSYMKCLCILISHFYGSEILQNEEVLCKEDRDILFSNILEVRNCSQRFLSDLKWCWEDDISLQDLDEIIYKHVEETFGAYITYCFNQVHQLNTLNKLMKSEVFIKAIDELQRNPVCRRKTLQCYLIMPMQRVTRIRLLVDAILARLSHDNQKYQGWKLLSDALNRVVQQCNDAAKHAALQEEAKSVCKKLDFSGFKHMDIDLGKRLLVHQGEVFYIYSSNDSSNHLGALSSTAYRKIMKQPFTFGRKLLKQPLHLFLFRDVLLVTKKKSDGIFMVLVYCPRSDVGICSGDPYSLQELPQKNFPEDWRNVFHLFMQKDCEKGVIEMIFSAPNEYEKELWLDAF